MNRRSFLRFLGITATTPAAVAALPAGAEAKPVGVKYHFHGPAMSQQDFIRKLEEARRTHAILDMDGYWSMSQTDRTELEQWLKNHDAYAEDIMLLHFHGAPLAWHAMTVFRDHYDGNTFQTISARHRILMPVPAGAASRVTYIHGDSPA